MHRIDTSTAQKDKFGAGKNGFTGGNPQTGELPTALDQDFFDSLQEEIAAVIEGAGVALDKTKNDQLLASLKILFPLGAAGKLGVASNSDMAAGTSTNLLTTPAGVMSLLGKRSFSQNDYIRIPDVNNGLIIQWGYVTVPSGSSTAVTFPTPFPLNCFNVQATNASTTTPAATPGVGGFNQTTFSIFGAKITDGTSAGQGASYYWMAIGR